MLQLILILFGILYFLSPFDLIPDFLPWIGRLDDLILIFAIYWNFFRKKSQEAPGDARSTSGFGSRQQSASGTGGGQSASRPRAEDPLKDPYRILEVPPTATPEEIKRAYRQQANRYHPDKVTHLGEEFQTLAKEKFQEIQWAYEELMRRHG